MDENGKPIAGAEIHIAENKPFSGHRLVQMYESDGDGRFLIENTPWGTYVVMAGKESAGYPDSRLAFYSNLSVPTVTLSPQFPVATLNLKIGPRAGILELASVADAVTGKRIDSAVVTLKRVNSDFFIKTSAPGARILIPAMTDVSIRIDAPGYDSWPPADQSKNGIIRLTPQQTLKLKITLREAYPPLRGFR